jgi:hypothetical protein
MASQADVRRIALSLPDTEEAPNHFAFSVRNKGKLKGFVSIWVERIAPKKARVPQPSVIAVRVASLDDKNVLLALDSTKFFTEPHYNGFPSELDLSGGCLLAHRAARVTPPPARKWAFVPGGS